MQAFILLTLQLFHKRLKQLAAFHEILKAVERRAGRTHDNNIATFCAGSGLLHGCFEVFHLDNRGMLALDILHALANLGCGSAGEQQQLFTWSQIG